MQRFTLKISSFLSLVFVVAIVGAMPYWFGLRYHLKTIAKADIYILGDSHTQNGLNPSYFDNAINLSASGEPYRYSYTKLRYLLKFHTPEYVILGYGCHNLSSTIDSLWVHNEGNIASKTASYFPLMQLEEVIFKNNPKQLASVVHEVVVQSIYALEYYLMKQNSPFIGGFTENAGSLLSVPSETSASQLKTDYSTAQLFYLQEIEKLCHISGSRLILVNTPTLSAVNCDLNKEKPKRAYFLDFGKALTDLTYFADANHLNPRGANALSSRVANQIKLRNWESISISADSICSISQ